MKIAFRRVGAGAQPVEIPLERPGVTLRFAGTLKRERQMIHLSGTLRGTLEVSCDSCGEPYGEAVDEPLDLWFSENPYEPTDAERERGAEMLDVIEAPDGEVDLLEVMEGEMNALLCEYHKCTTCKAKE